MKFFNFLFQKKILYISIFISLFIHTTVILEVPQVIYRAFVQVHYTEYENNKLQEIENAISELKNKRVAPKSLIKKTQNARLAFEEVKDSLKGTNPLPAINALKEYRQLQDELQGYGKQSSEDLEVLKEALSGMSNEIKENAKNRAISKDPLFNRFISKKNEEVKESINYSTKKESTPLKINVITHEEFLEREEKKKQNEECEAQFTYLGIGVAFNNGNTLEDRLDKGFYKITDIAEGYGAYEKGIRKGDVLLGAFDTKGNFYEGVEFIRDNADFINRNMEVLINRNGKPLKLAIPIQKICYKPR